MIFPSNNVWNTKADNLPLHQYSAAYVSTIGSSAGLRCDDSIPLNQAVIADPGITVMTSSAEGDPGGLTTLRGFLIAKPGVKENFPTRPTRNSYRVP